MSGYEWRPYRAGEPLPDRAVLAGRTGTDGLNYVCRVNNECGKVNLCGTNLANSWCHNGGESNHGEVLYVLPGYQAVWEHKKKGDSLPDGAVHAGSTPCDGDNYACRNGGGAGKVNINNGRVNNFWIHGNWFAKEDGDICCVRPVPSQGGGSSPAPAPVPHVEPQHEEHHDWHPPAHEDHGYTNWNPDADCAGARAEDRMRWLMDNQGQSMDAAKAQVMKEFPFVFREGHGRDWWEERADCDGIPAGDRAKWLMENEGYSEHAARVKVKTEFPRNFNGGGDFFNHGKFGHCMSLVDTPSGPRLKIEVLCNTGTVGLVAVHYQINNGAPMNFDIRHPEGRSKTYSHVTPDGGGYPLCRNGDRVSYWLAAEINGLISEEPEGACPNPAARMNWTAHH